MDFDFSRYPAVFLDLDGTICHENHLLPGALELLARLQDRREKYACLTNSTNSALQVVRRMAGMGITIEAEHIYTAGDGAVDYVLEKYGSGANVYNLATQGVQDSLEGKAKWVQRSDERCDAVICGVPIESYASDERQRVALALLHHGAALIGCCADRVYPSPRGLEFGSGALTSMLAYAANVTPVFTGKPEKVFFHTLCERLGVDPTRCLLIGDNLESDFSGVRAMGMDFILTLTGITARRHLDALSGDTRPKVVIEDLRELL